MLRQQGEMCSKRFLRSTRERQRGYGNAAAFCFPPVLRRQDGTLRDKLTSTPLHAGGLATRTDGELTLCRTAVVDGYLIPPHGQIAALNFVRCREMAGTR